MALPCEERQNYSSQIITSNKNKNKNKNNENKNNCYEKKTKKQHGPHFLLPLLFILYSIYNFGTNLKPSTGPSAPRLN